MLPVDFVEYFRFIVLNQMFISSSLDCVGDVVG